MRKIEAAFRIVSQVTGSSVAVQSPSAWTPSPCLEHSSSSPVHRPHALVQAVKVRDSEPRRRECRPRGPAPGPTFPSPLHLASSWSCSCGHHCSEQLWWWLAQLVHPFILSFSWTFPKGIILGKCMETQIPTKQRNTRVEEMNDHRLLIPYLGFADSFGWDCLAGPQNFCFFRLNQLLWFPRVLSQAHSWDWPTSCR